MINLNKMIKIKSKNPEAICFKISFLKKYLNCSIKITSLVVFLSAFNFFFPQTKEPETISNLDKAVVIIDGRTLFSIRGISAYPAKERAKLIEKRIEDIAKNPLIPADSVKIVHSENAEDILIAGSFIMGVHNVDAQLEGVSREILTSIIKQKIINAIYSYRFERESKTLLLRTFYALAATALMILILFLLSRFIKKVNLSLDKTLKTKIDSLEMRSFKIIKSNQLWIGILGTIRTSKIILIIIILFIYLQYVLGLYPWSRFISNSLLNLFLTPLRIVGISLLNFLPNLAFLIIIFLITKYSLKLIKIFFNGIGYGTITISGFEKEWAYPTYKIVRTLIIIFAVVVAYPYIPGSESAAFKGISVLMGLLLSLGSTSIIGNITAGYSMIYRRTFKKGDIVKIDDHIGQVNEIKLLVTKLKTFKNEEIVVPNSLVLKSNIINYTSPLKTEEAIILHTTIGIGYETPWRLVESMLLLAAERTEGLLKEPKPFVWQRSLGDFAVSYELNVYCNDPINMFKHYTKLHRNILDIFNENNVQIMTPAYRTDPDKPKVVPKDRWHTPVKGTVEK